MKIIEIKQEIVLSMDYKDLIEYMMALENMLFVYTDSLGQIGENSNSLRRLRDDFRKIDNEVQGCHKLD